MNIKRIGLIGGNGVPVGGSSGTGSSTTVVDNLESLSKSAALSANMGRELNETKAPKVGYAPDLKVSYAEELVGRGESTPEVIGAIRPTSGEESSIKDGNATIERIKGESVVWNQVLSENKFKVTLATLEEDDDYYKIIPKDKYANRFQQLRNVIKDHIYLQTAIVYNTSNVDTKFQNYLGLIISKSSSTTNKSIPTLIWGIEKATETIDSYIQITNQNTLDPFWVKKNSFFLYDLTLMFGAGNEPTTIEEFEARKPLGVTNEYNEGTIVSFQGGDVKSVGFNAWDEEWEKGTISTQNGNEIASDTQIRSSKIHLIPDVDYYGYFGATNGAMWILFYDNENNLIAHSTGKAQTNFASNIANYLFKAPSDVAYARFYTTKEYGATYNHDICIHLVHSGYRNGDYEPYVDDVHPLPDIKSIKDSNGDILFPYGLLSAGSVHDEITATKAIKRIGVVDMGSLTWMSQQQTAPIEYLCLYADGLTNATIKVNKVPNALNARYTAVSDLALTNANGIGSLDKSYNFAMPQRILLRDDSYTSAADFKAAMQGVLLYYELAEPIEVDLPEPLNMTYEAWDFGTEELLAKGATTPLNADIVYLFNAVDRIRENSTKNTKLEARIKILEDTIALLTTQTPDEGETANE